MNDLLALLASQGAAVVFLATLAARLGAPVPAVPFLIVAGGLSVGGGVSFAAVTAAAVVGNVLGDGAWFLAGRRWGYRVMRLLCRISLSADTCVQRSESILGRWGGLSLVAAKFVPGVSVVAPPMAGALGMSNARFLSYETAGALIWTLGFLLVGVVFHAAIKDVLAVLSEIGLAAAAICGALLGLFMAWRYRLRRAALAADGIEHIAVDVLRAALAGASAPSVIDVRGAAARALDTRTIPGAVGIELKHLPQRLGPLADGRELVVFC
ncbi:VTT domain-containing protein, partial [Variovorax sp. dw_308]